VLVTAAKHDKPLLALLASGAVASQWGSRSIIISINSRERFCVRGNGYRLLPRKGVTRRLARRLRTRLSIADGTGGGERFHLNDQGFHELCNWGWDCGGELFHLHIHCHNSQLFHLQLCIVSAIAASARVGSGVGSGLGSGSGWDWAWGWGGGWGWGWG